MTTPQTNPEKCPASGRTARWCSDQTHTTCHIGIAAGVKVDRYQDRDPWATPTSQPIVEWVAPRDRTPDPRAGTAALNAHQKTGTEPIKPASDAR